MFVSVSISSNLLRTLLSFVTNNSKFYVTKNGKKSPRRKYHNVTSLEIDVIERYYYIQKKELNRKQQQQ